MTPEPFPWEEAMAFGLGRLRHPPEVFWAMTLPELFRAVEGLSGIHRQAAPSRVELKALMAASPDLPSPGASRHPLP